MSIQFKCPGCSQGVKVSMAMAGKKGKCPGCGKTLQIPSEEKLKKLQAKLAAASATATSAPAPPAPSPPADDPFDDLPQTGWDDDDFDFSEPEAPAEEANPYASPLAGYEQQMKSSKRGGGSKNYAGFWLRLGAAFVDGITLSAIGKATELIVTVAILGDAEEDEVSLSFAFGYLCFMIVVQWLYYALQEASASQATFGKRAVGLIVTDQKGQPISFARATIRYFAKIASYLSLMIGFFMIGFTPKKQALHDMIAGTLVVKA